MKPLTRYDLPRALPKHGFALGALLISSSPHVAAAVEIKISGLLDSSVEYNDNIFLASTGKTSATSYSTAPRVTVTAEDERNKTTLTGHGYVERFDGISNRDVNDYGVSLDESYLATERLTLGANASYSRESLLRAEIQDTGLISLTGHRTNVTAGGSMSYKLGPTDTVSLTGQYSDQNYSSAGLIDYSEYQASLAWQRQLNERFSLTTSVSGAIEEPGSTLIPRSKYGQATLGLNYALSEVTSIGAYAGANYVDSSLFSSGKVGVSAGANANLEYEFTTITFSASRGVSPSGIGQLSRSTTASASVSQRLSEHLYFDTDANIRFLKSQTSVLFSLNCRYYDGRASLRWEFARYFGLSAYYQYRRQRFTGGSPWASANTIGAHLVMHTEPRE